MQTDSKMKVVFVGCGGVSHAWLEPMAEFNDIEVVGLVDLNLDNASSVREKYGLRKTINCLHLSR